MSQLGIAFKEWAVICRALAEGREPEEVDEFMTAFFAAMSDVVFRHEGTLDQLTGQGVRAFFGDPEPQEDHALRAVRCSPH